MPRKPRIRAQGLYHHVVHRGINRQRIFFDDIDKRRFLNSLSDAAQRCGLDVLAYCLMDNHYHLLFWDPNAQISRVMALINGSYTSYINRRHKRDGALLRGRFYSNPSDESRYALCVLRYIHLNPVTAGMTQVPEAYDWSSHRLYMRATLSGIVTIQHMLEVLASIGVSLKEFNRWVCNPLSSFRYDEKMAQRQLLAFARKKCTRPAMITPKPLDAQKIVKLTTEKDCRTRRMRVIAAVARHYGVDVNDMWQAARGYKDPRTKARYVAAFACFFITNATYDELSTLFGIARNSVGVFLLRGKALSTGCDLSKMA